VKRFRYLADPLFLAGCALYAANRFLIRPHTGNDFMRFWFNDLLLIPCALPIVLLFQKTSNLRRHDFPPTFWEVAGHLVFWSALFEWAGPFLIRRATGDPMDVAAYAVGAAAAYFFWNKRSRIAADEL
jgi:hypothetical protein